MSSISFPYGVLLCATKRQREEPTFDFYDTYPNNSSQKVTSPLKTMDVEVGKGKGRLPFKEWWLNLNPTQRSEWLDKEQARREKKGGKKTTRKRKRTGRSGGSRKRSRTGSSRGYSGTNIIYPNVIGRGAYYLGGHLGYDSEKGFTGGASGYITDSVQGLGGYNVRRNSLLSAVDLGQDPPRVANTNRGEATIINHREYLGDLFSGAGTPSNFDLRKYELNPGNSSLFPFLSSIAKQFQEYEIRGMLIELKSLSSEYASNLALGSYFMAADYNVYGNDPATKQQLENMEYASSAKPSKSMIMPIECDPSNNMMIHKNVAINSEYHTGDKRLYDWCNVYIGSQGIPQANTPLAEIWLTYEIALFKPIISGNDQHHNTGEWDAAVFQTVNVTTEHNAGNVVVANATNSEGYGIRFTGESDPYGVAILDLPDMVAGHQPVYFKVEYVVSQGGIFTDVPSDLLAPYLEKNGAVDWVDNIYPVAGVASADEQFFTVEDKSSELIDPYIKYTWSANLVRTGQNTGGGKSEASLQFSGGVLATASRSRGLLTVTTYPGPFKL